MSAPIYESRNPATGELADSFDCFDNVHLETVLQRAKAGFSVWAGWSYQQRASILLEAAAILRERRDEYSRLISLEMGKLKVEADGEIEKCAKACEFYAENAERLLTDNSVATEAHKSYVTYQPMGPIFAIMPWNFPFWQVFRFLVTTLMAGNVALLKHAPSVPLCALAIEELWEEAGAPEGVMQTLLIDTDQAADVIADSRVQGVSLTGSVEAGRKVGALAGQHLKKIVLELGGSDPLVVLEDADIKQAAETAIKSRFSNAGQVCVAAKRFIVVDAVADEFVAALMEGVEKLQYGDPRAEGITLAPMARKDLRDKVAAQVDRCIEQGAKLLTGAFTPKDAGFFYPATVLDRVQPGMLAFEEEIFGPVAAIIRVADEGEALQLANETHYGLGASVWTRDVERGEKFARKLQAGACFVNHLVGSDIRMSFGGSKSSGVGRELGEAGIREFCNIKSIWVDR